MIEQADSAITGELRKEAGARNIAGFDGIRAISIGMVLVAHAGYDRIIPGGTGVTIFFAISGFLITNLLLAEIGSTGKVDFARFYARRALRLYPELIVLIVLCLVAAIHFDWQASFGQIGAALFYYMNYFLLLGDLPARQFVYPWTHLWSLSVEEHFYFFWPLLIAFFVPRQRLVVPLTAMILGPLLWRWAAFNLLHLGEHYNYWATETRIDSIAWGCLTAFLLFKPAGSNGLDPLHRLTTWPYLMLGVAAMLMALIIRDEEFRWVWRFSIQGAGLSLIIANLLFDPRWRWVVSILEWRPIVYIGRISYGLYLYHLLGNAVLLTRLRDGTLRFLFASIALSVCLASLSYFLVEVPVKPWRRRLGSATR